jgi:uncharacterized membrane protein
MATKTFLLDLAERTVATYLEAFLGLLLAGQVTDLSAAKAAAIAAIPAGLAVIKGALAGAIGPKSGASALPARAPRPIGEVDTAA